MLLNFRYVIFFFKLWDNRVCGDKIPRKLFAEHSWCYTSWDRKRESYEHNLKACPFTLSKWVLALKFFKGFPKCYQTAATRENMRWPTISQSHRASVSTMIYSSPFTLTVRKRLREKCVLTFMCSTQGYVCSKPNNEFAGPLLRGNGEIK